MNIMRLKEELAKINERKKQSMCPILFFINLSFNIMFLFDLKEKKRWTL